MPQRAKDLIQSAHPDDTVKAALMARTNYGYVELESIRNGIGGDELTASYNFVVKTEQSLQQAADEIMKAWNDDEDVEVTKNEHGYVFSKGVEEEWIALQRLDAVTETEFNVLSKYLRVHDFTKSSELVDDAPDQVAEGRLRR